jgi:RNA-splicing ligase RtcB
MKDGVILGKGKGNALWNMSAPHGSGRLYKREDVQKQFSVSAYKKAVDGIYSSCINRSTLDESPFCYRNLSDIQDAVCETVQIEHLLKPLYNYKDNTENRNADTD